MNEDIPTIDEPVVADNVPVVDEAEGAALPKNATLQDDGSVLVTFKRPVTLRFRSTQSGDVREEAVAQLLLHRLTGADMNAISAASAEARASMSFARSARMPPAKMKLLYEKMDGADVMAIAAVIGFFLDNGATTGR